MSCRTIARGALFAGGLLLAGAIAAPQAHLAEARPAARQQRAPRPAPPRRLPPNRVRPGGGLNPAQQACSDTTEALTALVPIDNPVMTERAYPSFWFYIPDRPEAIQSGEFILLSADEKEQVYAAPISLDQTPGFVRLQLPETLPVGLAAAADYHWYLNLTCQADAGEETVLSVNGWIYRTDAIAQPDDSPAELWYDEVDQTALRLLTDPEDSSAQQAWREILRRVDLVAPLVPLS
ncbi:MAG: DUF928 domain-containing protein [Leptolyngbya sp. SIO4C1]|nr:DUF928 domain-containing protein [Leptolyngbya sp. SIO4C1]